MDRSASGHRATPNNAVIDLASAGAQTTPQAVRRDRRYRPGLRQGAGNRGTRRGPGCPGVDSSPEKGLLIRQIGIGIDVIRTHLATENDNRLDIVKLGQLVTFVKPDELEL